MRDTRPNEDFIVWFDDVFTTLVWRAMHPLTLKAVAQMSKTGRQQMETPLYQILKMISSRGELRITELAEALGVTAATASRHISTLVERGYVERIADPSDGRAQIARLSRNGAAQLRRERQSWQKLLAEVLESWPEADRRQLTESMERLEEGFAELHQRVSAPKEEA